MLASSPEESSHVSTGTHLNEELPEKHLEEGSSNHALPKSEPESHSDTSELKMGEHSSASEPKTVSHEKELSLHQHEGKEDKSPHAPEPPGTIDSEKSKTLLGDTAKKQHDGVKLNDHAH